MSFMQKFVKPCLEVVALIAPAAVAEDLKRYDANLKCWEIILQQSKVAGATAAAGPPS